MSDLTLKNVDLWKALVSVDGNGPLADLVALDTPLPASNLLRRSLRLAREHSKDMLEEHQKLVQEFSVKDDEGKQVPDGKGGIKLTDEAAFVAKFNTLMDVPVTLPGAVAVKVSDLGTVKFSGAKLDLLIGSFLVDDTEPKKET